MRRVRGVLASYVIYYYGDTLGLLECSWGPGVPQTNPRYLPLWHLSVYFWRIEEEVTGKARKSHPCYCQAYCISWNHTSRISPSHIPGYQHDPTRPPPTKSLASHPSAYHREFFPLHSPFPSGRGHLPSHEARRAHPRPQTHKAYRASRATRRVLSFFPPETGCRGRSREEMVGW